MFDALVYRPLTPGQASPLLAAMTFPVYRRLLSLEPSVRHPDLGEQRLAKPHAMVALDADAPVGLALFEQAIEAPQDAELLSLFVAAAARNRGVATGLLTQVAEQARALGAATLSAVYMTGKPSVAALERVFAKCAWRPPEPRAIAVRFTPESAAAAPWFGRVPLPSDASVFPWAELTAGERAWLERSHRETPWIAAGLEPWRHDGRGFHAPSSLGLRLDGQVVGWVINHAIAPDTIRFTCSFIRADLGRLGRILPLYTESIRRLRADGIRQCTLVTPVHYRAMARFLDRRCAAWVTARVESRGTSRRLGRGEAGKG